jgi:hypothetical protein
MTEEDFDIESWNRKDILQYYNAMLSHRPNFDLDTELFIKFANILPRGYVFGKVIPRIVLYYFSGHKKIAEWKIDKEGNVEDFTPEGILRKLEKASKDKYNLKDIDLTPIIRDWKVIMLTEYE